MDQKRNRKQNPTANDAVWDVVNELTGTIEAGKEMNMEIQQEPSPVTLQEKQHAAFLSIIHRDDGIGSQPQTSMLERWTFEHTKKHWFARVHERLSRIESHYPQRHEVQDLFASMRSTLEILSERLVPAPAYRDAAAVREWVYQPRRRAIESADLPAFHPLFCTSVDASAAPFSLAGLTPDTPYVFSLYGIKNGESLFHQEIQSNGEGGVKIDFAGTLKQLQHKHAEEDDYVWFLWEKRAHDQQTGSWASGMIWLESETRCELENECTDAIAAPSGKEHPDAQVDTLFSIHWLTARGYYVQAYEQARQYVLFAPQPCQDENHILFKESLWRTIENLVAILLQKMEKAESLYQRIKPEWNAAESLRELQHRLKEWE